MLARAWGAKVVRISVLPGSFKHEPEAALAGLWREVDAALWHGLYVIVVWHAIGIPDGYHFRPPAEWGLPWDAYDSNFAMATAFWDAVGRRYGNEGRVMFELWNEPVHKDSEKVGAKPWKELKAFYVRLLGTVRQHGNNVALCGGLKWSRDLNGIKMNPLADPNTAYCWHVYPGQDKGSAAAWERRLDGLPANRPVIATEWGFDADPGQEASAFFTPLDRYPLLLAERFLPRMAGWVGWSWQPAWGPSLIHPDWRTPTAAGHFVRDLLARPPA